MNTNIYISNLPVSEGKASRAIRFIIQNVGMVARNVGMVTQNVGIAPQNVGIASQNVGFLFGNIHFNKILNLNIK